MTLPDDLRILFQTGAISHDELMRRYHLASQRECEWGTCGHAGAPGVVWSSVMAHAAAGLDIFGRRLR